MSINYSPIYTLNCTELVIMYTYGSIDDGFGSSEFSSILSTKFSRNESEEGSEGRFPRASEESTNRPLLLLTGQKRPSSYIFPLQFSCLIST